MELKPINEKDYEKFYIWRDEELSRKFNPLKEVTLEQLKEKFSKDLSDLSEILHQAHYRFGIYVDDKLIGSVSLHTVNTMMMTAEVGYLIGEEFYGKGYATEAVKLLVNKVFTETDIRKLYATVALDNIGSRRVAEKNGFSQEGILREHFLIQGNPVDEVVYGLLRSEFKA